MRGAEECAERAPHAGLLPHLTQRSVLPALPRLELSLRQRPVVVPCAVNEQDEPVANDDASRCLDQTSMRSASPWPPPEQIAARPSPPPFRRSSWTIVPRMRPPLAPIGCPSATAPPFTFTFSGSAPSIFTELSATDENASLTSTRSTSPIDLPAFSSAWVPAFAGVRASHANSSAT